WTEGRESLPAGVDRGSRCLPEWTEGRESLPAGVDRGNRCLPEWTEGRESLPAGVDRGNRCLPDGQRESLPAGVDRGNRCLPDGQSVHRGISSCQSGQSRKENRYLQGIQGGTDNREGQIWITSQGPVTPVLDTTYSNCM
ncbi:Hypothetical predicted protein, partial [Pelobates cultripes]